jgi:hypothetical protein
VPDAPAPSAALPSAPAPMTEEQWRAREDPLQNLTPDQRDVHEWHEFDKRVTRSVIDPLVKTLAVGARVASVAGGPELFMLVNQGLDDVDDQENWGSTGGPKDLRLARDILGIFWGSYGALTAESRVTRQAATAIEDMTESHLMVDDAVDLYFGGVKFEGHRPRFDPDLPPRLYGQATSGKHPNGPAIQIGEGALESPRQLLETIVHEEMHFRRWYKNVPTDKHHDAYFNAVIERYFRMKGWVRP